MSTSFRRTIACLLILGFFSPAEAEDQHSVEAIKDALLSPIPEEVIREAQGADDALLTAGQSDGQRVYLVTDARSTKLQSVVNKLLTSTGEDPAKWVVRLLHTDPSSVNAFVFGGRYIYVYTGLIDEAESEDELAFVLGHELGHSLLKHASRRAADTSTTLANLAEIVAALGGGSTKDGAEAIAQALTASYSQDDEREADALAVAISRRAGFDPLRGADFFTRDQREQDTAEAEEAQSLAERHHEVLQLKANCEGLQRQWNSSWTYQTEENAELVNTTCAEFKTQADEYNRTANASNAEKSQKGVTDLFSTHPPAQDRVAGVAAVTDFMRGVRSLDALQNFQQAQRVMTALTQTDSILLTPAKTRIADAPSGSTDSRDVQARLAELKSVLASGLITPEEYASKRQKLIEAL